jgi:hypothetical protein
MNEWISVKDKPAPKEGKFLFKYYYGIGLGEWAQCYTIFNGNSERTHQAYILILWPSEILDGKDPFEWNEEYMIEMEVSWMPLPKQQEKCE